PNDDGRCLETVDASAKEADHEKLEIGLQETELLTDAVDGSEVPPHPPKSRKRDIIPDPAAFKQIDEHALK
ncbi:hypothetical protein CHS0354_024372, partial [Potamilus streckersoni]